MPLGAFAAPVHLSFRRSGEQDKQARRVGAKFSCEHVGIHNVALGLRHLRAFGDHHALSKQLLYRLAVLHEADIAHYLCKKTRIDQVQDGVFHPADVLVDLKPVRDFLRIEGCAIVLRIAIPVEIPGRIDKRVHGVGLAPGGAAALRTLHVDERGNIFERRSAPTRNLHVERQQHGEFGFRNSNHAIVGAMDHRNWSSPIALAQRRLPSL